MVTEPLTLLLEIERRVWEFERGSGKLRDLHVVGLVQKIEIELLSHPHKQLANGKNFSAIRCAFDVAIGRAAVGSSTRGAAVGCPSVPAAVASTVAAVVAAVAGVSAGVACTVLVGASPCT